MNDISVYRSEDKYILNKIGSMQLENTLSKILKHDEHCKENGRYKVRSLYFDSINNSDFENKMAGTEIRKKIRLRTFDPKDKMCKLEVKYKNCDLQHKTSLWIEKEDAKELIDGNYSVLFKYFDKSEIAIYLYKEMTLGAYTPNVMIEYERAAFIYPEFNTRITLDYNISASEMNFDLFDENIEYIPILTENTILEVKYDKKLMKFISEILRNYNLTKTAASKYCMGRENYYKYLS